MIIVFLKPTCSMMLAQRQSFAVFVLNLIIACFITKRKLQSLCSTAKPFMSVTAHYVNNT